MTKIDHYAQILQTLTDWDSYLLQNSGLPGPRGNIELGRAFARLADETAIEKYLSYTPALAPVNSPYEFLAFCGVLGLGRLVVEGQKERLAVLRQMASDPRWRIREGVAMALQQYGCADIAALVEEMKRWLHGGLLEKRAVAAALCEPVLLQEHWVVQRVLDILDQITASIKEASDRKSEEFRVLRKALGYCWSVAVAAWPEMGKGRMEKWMDEEDRDIRWIMKENLRKNRLLKMDGEWVANWLERLRL
jgi:hypothetical protein